MLLWWLFFPQLWSSQVPRRVGWLCVLCLLREAGQPLLETGHRQGPEHGSQNIWPPPRAHSLGLSSPRFLRLSEKSVPELLAHLMGPSRATAATPGARGPLTWELVRAQLPQPPPGAPKLRLSHRWAAGRCWDSSGFRCAPWLFERLAGEFKLYL